MNNLNDNLINMIIEAAKEAAKGMIKNGAKSEDVFNAMIKKFGPEAGRLIIIDLGMDLGKTEASQAYFDQMYA